MLYGGVSSGRTVTDNCATPDVPDQFCRQTLPLTEFKLSGVQPLPWWGLQVSATYQNLPGVPQAATYLATNAEIAPSLGRNLSACPAATGPCNATALVPQLLIRLATGQRIPPGLLQLARCVAIPENAQGILAPLPVPLRTQYR